MTRQFHGVLDDKSQLHHPCLPAGQTVLWSANDFQPLVDTLRGQQLLEPVELIRHACHCDLGINVKLSGSGPEPLAADVKEAHASFEHTTSSFFLHAREASRPRQSNLSFQAKLIEQ